MTLTLRSDPAPLRMDEDGTVRVGNTRVLLEIVIRAFKRGATPADIVRSYPSLELADAHAVVAYYLRHQDEVEAYLQECDAQAAAIRQKIEASQPPRPGLKEELLARWNNLGKDNASPAQ